ncbi:hypothetical protein RJ639_034007 [Escallonia herrerae]|uniref:Uncharacterized protein n=1 Tax=Escallonia herrerae TaxID=1293975 RepID=A0AA88WT17_9ASTE|nr:hypothetical protein RJ639_034007 [Escallonia herrerae]
MKEKKESSRIVKPTYNGKTHASNPGFIPLSVFDKVTEWAGRLDRDDIGNSIILLNDEGVKFVEASVDGTLDEAVSFKPSASLLALHPCLKGVVELVQVQLTRVSLAKLKQKASSENSGPYRKPYSTFESLVAHLWRAITKSRAVDNSETTYVRISVNGRTRLNPRVPKDYFGNLVLWAFPSAKVKELLREPLPYAAKLIHDAVAKVNNNYFKSFIDFANYKVEEEDLVPTADMNKNSLCPNLEVDSWLRFPFYDLDFGGGCLYVFMPSYFPTEGMMFLLPSFIGDGSIDAFVPVFQDNLATFKQVCYSLD